MHVGLSVCLSACLPACLPGWLAGWLSVCLSVSMHACIGYVYYVMYIEDLRLRILSCKVQDYRVQKAYESYAALPAEVLVTDCCRQSCFGPDELWHLEV